MWRAWLAWLAWLACVPGVAALVGGARTGRTVASSPWACATSLEIPTRGITSYDGKVMPESYDLSIEDDRVKFKPGLHSLPDAKPVWWGTPSIRKVALHPQLVIKLELSGDLSLGPKAWAPFGSSQNEFQVQSLHDLMTLFLTAAHDPQVDAIYIHLGQLSAGYAKLQEVKRFLRYFQAAGKRVVGYSTYAAEREYFLASIFDEFYVPPCGELDLRGFVSTSPFYGGLLEKIGVEPHVQRIGAYKSAGDSIQRSDMSAEHREASSSLISEASSFWAESVAQARNISVEQVRALWSEHHDTKTLRDRGFLTALAYPDDVEASLRRRLRRPMLLLHKLWRWLALAYPLTLTVLPLPIGPLPLVAEFLRSVSPRTLTPLRRYNLALPPVEGAFPLPKNVSLDFNLTEHYLSHPRRAAVPDRVEGSEPVSGHLVQLSLWLESASGFLGRFSGALRTRREARWVSEPHQVSAPKYLSSASAKSGPLPIKHARSGPRIAIINVMGTIVDGTARRQSDIGSDDVISLLHQARRDEHIYAVVLRIDSPGGSALASDLVWKELRALSASKPVVASMVDVAASGGYYFAMACDQVLAEGSTITGSVGVVSAAFTAQELMRKTGYKEEALSIGRFAEVRRQLGRNYSEEERQHMESAVQGWYRDFVQKAAAGRNLTFDEMHQLAQGRVWMGHQALERGLVDGIGGLWKALDVAARLGAYPLETLRVEVLAESLWTKCCRTPSGWSGGASASARKGAQVWALCSEEAYASGLLPMETSGLSPGMQAMLLASPLLTSPLLRGVEQALRASGRWSAVRSWFVL